MFSMIIIFFGAQIYARDTVFFPSSCAYFFVRRLLTTVKRAQWAHWTRHWKKKPFTPMGGGILFIYFFFLSCLLAYLSARYQRTNSTRLYCIGTDRKEIPIFPCTHTRIYIFFLFFCFFSQTYTYLRFLSRRAFNRGDHGGVSLAKPSFSSDVSTSICRCAYSTYVYVYLYIYIYNISGVYSRFLRQKISAYRIRILEIPVVT